MGLPQIFGPVSCKTNLALEELPIAVFFDERNKGDRNADGICCQPDEFVEILFGRCVYQPQLVENALHHNVVVGCFSNHKVVTFRLVSHASTLQKGLHWPDQTVTKKTEDFLTARVGRVRPGAAVEPEVSVLRRGPPKRTAACKGIRSPGRRRLHHLNHRHLQIGNASGGCFGRDCRHSLMIGWRVLFGQNFGAPISFKHAAFQ